MAPTLRRCSIIGRGTPLGVGGMQLHGWHLGEAADAHLWSVNADGFDAPRRLVAVTSWGGLDTGGAQFTLQVIHCHSSQIH